MSSEHSEIEQPVREIGEPERSDLSRRTFLGGSAALAGTFLLTRGALAQTAARTKVGGAVAGGTLPHDFGLRAAPIAPRQPLAKVPFVALPLGSVKARGWLLKQLELQRDGLTGHAEEVLLAAAPDSAWKGGSGEDWEKGPYYLKGLVTLAYTLDDAGLKEKVKAWIEPILASQRPDGFFGPTQNNDWWPRMVVTYILRDYAEATDDDRVVPFLTRYYKHMLEALPKRPLQEWGRARAGDEIDSVLWLYNRTGDDFLLSVADLLARQAYPWRQIFTENRFLEYGADFHPKHAVNVPQALKMPVVYSQRSGRAEDKAAYRAAIVHLMRDHGTTFGINTGTEMLSGRSALEGVETCSTVEHMLSAETALRILGDATIGDELEVVAFNALPAAFSKDFRQHVYYTVSNNVSAARGGMGYEQDYSDGRTPAPRSGFPCCCYNMHMGWPKLAQNAWAATPGGGLAIMTYVPSQVSAQVAEGSLASIVCETNYPFEETIRLSVGLKENSRFPLVLRIPAWSRSAQVKVNGKGEKITPGTFHTINRTWKNGDHVELTFPMAVQVQRGVKGSVSVRRGPLVYALGLTEKWTSFEKNGVTGFESYDVTSDSPWNYALELDAVDPAKSFRVLKKKTAANPFATGQSPIALRVPARRVDEWKMRHDGRNALDPPQSPVTGSGQTEMIELVPFGSQMLRVSAFPTLGTAVPSLADWKEDFSGDYSQRWVAYYGSWIRDGRLNLLRGGKAVAPRAQFAGVVYEGDVIVGDKGDAGLLLRVSDPTVGNDNYKGYYVGISAETQELIIGKSSNGWTMLVKTSAPVVAGKAHRLKVEAKGASFRVWLDGLAIPSANFKDASFTAGSLGVRSYANSAAFGNLSAIKI